MISAKRMPRIARSILFRTFVQGESRSQVYLDYAEPPPKVHLYERFYFYDNLDNKRQLRV